MGKEYYVILLHKALLCSCYSSVIFKYGQIVEAGGVL